MTEYRILWVDDEIEFLRPHILFLNGRGYRVDTATNGDDGVSMVRANIYDAALLDEMMPGKDGLTTLGEIKEIRPGLPVIMITKNEEESLMEEAIGSKIDNYLTKPVNPSQILMVLKKITEGKKLSEEKQSRDYIREFNSVNRILADGTDWKGWADIHLKLSQWELELNRHPDEGLKQSLEGQRESCNSEFGRFIENNYLDWVSGSDRPMMSVDFTGKLAIPALRSGKKVVMVIIDCMRLDQWLSLEGLLSELFSIKREFYYSILPSATPFARNAIFSGLFPSEIEKMHPDLWGSGEEDEASSNRHERQLLERQVENAGVTLKPELKYVKILDQEEGLWVEKKIDTFYNAPLTAFVVNFVDILAHSRASSDVIKEITQDESAYRSIVRSWFEHSPIFRILRGFSKQKDTVVLMTSDHGSIRVLKGSKVISDKEASTNLRYKYGRNLKCEMKHALFIKDPAEYKLPQRGINVNYIIAKDQYYFIYPTNFNKYLSFFKNSFQHGGISLEEMVLPYYILTPR